MNDARTLFGEYIKTWPTDKEFRDWLVSELTAANARIAELEAALEPFAREAVGWAKHIKNTYHPIMAHEDDSEPFGHALFTVGDLRSAAEALKDNP